MSKNYKCPDYIIEKGYTKNPSGEFFQFTEIFNKWCLNSEINYFLDTLNRLPPKHYLRESCLQGLIFIGSEKSTTLFFKLILEEAKLTKQAINPRLDLIFGGLLGKKVSSDILEKMITLYSNHSKLRNLFLIWIHEHILRNKQFLKIDIIIAFIKKGTSPYPLMDKLPLSLLEIERGVPLPEHNSFSVSSYSLPDIHPTEELESHTFSGKVIEATISESLNFNISGIFTDDGLQENPLGKLLKEENLGDDQIVSHYENGSVTSYIQNEDDDEEEDHASFDQFKNGPRIFDISILQSRNIDQILRNLPLLCLGFDRENKVYKEELISTANVKKRILSAKEAFQLIFFSSMCCDPCSTPSAAKARGRAWLCMAGLLGFEKVQSLLEIEKKAKQSKWMCFRTETTIEDSTGIHLLCIRDEFRFASIVST